MAASKHSCTAGNGSECTYNEAPALLLITSHFVFDQAASEEAASRGRSEGASSQAAAEARVRDPPACLLGAAPNPTYELRRDINCATMG